MMEILQLNWHIRGPTKNNFGVIVVHYSNDHYSLSHFIPYGCWNVTNYCWATTKTASCCLEACSQFSESKLTSTTGFARQKTAELIVSLMPEMSGQILSKPSLNKWHRKQAQIFCYSQSAFSGWYSWGIYNCFPIIQPWVVLPECIQSVLENVHTGSWYHMFSIRRTVPLLKPP